MDQLPAYIKICLFVSLAAACLGVTCSAIGVSASGPDIHEATKDWIFPATGTISDTFNTRYGTHKGLDIAGRYRAKVFSAQEGTVIRSYLSASYGHVVFVRHPSGYETVYAHLAGRAVRAGQHVEKGKVVGYMGSTGHSTGIHLHFEVHRGSWTPDKKNAIDPFLIFGTGAPGQTVSANAHDPYGVFDASAIPQPVAYTVKKGDTLWNIALHFHTSVGRLKSWNKLRSDRIMAGQVLKIKNE
ncbi:peptidoglycan DD-metalloendopeptidase family protein [Heyndrickxia coagulans]|uniref:peptidoglycan DD-metalloendopeptidase family protein n=1 Tax=Heyndrickxia coagulans TaxID=1398 RepID=UPI00352D77A7